MASRWVLAFSRQCPKCARLAARVEQAAEGRLLAQPLNGREIERARHQVFGEQPPWTPTLLAFDDGRVRAWTGLRLKLRLALLLGPCRTLRVLRILRSPAEWAADPKSPSAAPSPR